MSGINDFDRAHIGQILAGAGDERWSYFTAHLLRLIAKADQQNLERLATLYAPEVAAVLEWRYRGGHVYVEHPSPVDRLVAAVRRFDVPPGEWRSMTEIEAARAELDAALEPFA